MSASNENAERLLTTHQAGKLLQVNPGSITNWVKAGRLEAFRTPGGHLRIRTADLLAFLDAHEMPVPARLSRVASPKLLIVDDDEKQLKALSRLLRSSRSPVDVACFQSGIDALVHVGTFKPDLIILDVVMPEVNGLEVCQRLKQAKETSWMKVIVVSGRLTDETRRAAKRAGADKILSKPISLETILKELGISAAPPPPTAQEKTKYGASER